MSEETQYFMDHYSHEDSTVFYTGTNIPGPGVDPAAVDVTLCVGCSCESTCAGHCACVQFSGGWSNYINNRLNIEKLSSSSFILECNTFCKCTLNCENRVVQFGPINSLSVFKTDLKGYGLKTDSYIERGSFICEYAGELIGRDEANKRAHQDSINYIFVLKEHFSTSITETIVDPTRIGNIGRYINHSCQPNSAIVPVRVDSPVPWLAVFAVQDIQSGEEITYDYASGGSGIGKIQCFCKTAKCRGFLPFDKDLLS